MLLCQITGAYDGAHLLEWPVSGTERKLSFELGCFRICPEAVIQHSAEECGVGGLPTFFCPGVLDPARHIEKGPPSGDRGPSIWES